MINLESIQHKLSSDYSLNIYFSRSFPYIDSPSFSPYKPLQNVDFSKVGNMQFFFRNCTHIILTRTQAKKFDTFLVKIASKRTSLNQFKPILSDGIYQHHDAYQNQGSRKLDNLFCGKGSSVNYTNLRLLEYMLQSHESSWRFPTTLQTIPNLSMINLKRSSVEQLKTQ